SIVKSDFAADGGHAKRIAVMSNAADHAGQQRTIAAPVFRMIQRTKAQAVQRGYGTRSHREHVAQNPADSRRRTLKRLNKRRVIVRFNFEGSTPAVADIDDAGVLAGGHDDAFAGGG